jgi:hypothetical protein
MDMYTQDDSSQLNIVPLDAITGFCNTQTKLRFSLERTNKVDRDINLVRLYSPAGVFSETIRTYEKHANWKRL